MMSSESTEVLSYYTTQDKIKTNSTQFARTAACQVLTNCSNNFTHQRVCKPRIWIAKKNVSITESLICAVA